MKSLRKLVWEIFISIFRKKICCHMFGASFSETQISSHINMYTGPYNTSGVAGGYTCH